ncbi:hypothetical protein PR048_033151, partial [Dryococelus australis]
MERKEIQRRYKERLKENEEEWQNFMKKDELRKISACDMEENLIGPYFGKVRNEKERKRRYRAKHKQTLRKVVLRYHSSKVHDWFMSNLQLWIISHIPEDYDIDTMLTWMQWHDIEGRPKVVSIEGSRVQENCFDQNKTGLEADELFDKLIFPKTTLRCQDEVQSARRNHSQVTVFMCAAWLKGVTLSYAVISDDISHDKYSVWVFLKKIVEDINLTYAVGHISVLSDGCTY